MLGRRARAPGGVTSGVRVPDDGPAGRGARRPWLGASGRRATGGALRTGGSGGVPVSGRGLTRTVRGVHPPVGAPRSGEGTPPGGGHHPASPLRGTRCTAVAPRRVSGSGRRGPPPAATGGPAPRMRGNPWSEQVQGGDASPLADDRRSLARHDTRRTSARHGTAAPHPGDNRRPLRFTCRLTRGHHPCRARRVVIRTGVARQGRVTRPCSTIQSTATSAGSSPSTSTRRLRARSASSVRAGEIWS